MNSRHAPGVKRKTGPPGSLESRSAMFPSVVRATSTQFAPVFEYDDLAHGVVASSRLTRIPLLLTLAYQLVQALQ